MNTTTLDTTFTEKWFKRLFYINVIGSIAFVPFFLMFSLSVGEEFALSGLLLFTPLILGLYLYLVLSTPALIMYAVFQVVLSLLKKNGKVKMFTMQLLVLVGAFTYLLYLFYATFDNLPTV